MTEARKRFHLSLSEQEVGEIEALVEGVLEDNKVDMRNYPGEADDLKRMSAALRRLRVLWR